MYGRPWPVGAFTFEDLVALTVSKPLLGLKVLMLCVRSAGARWGGAG